MSTITPQQFVAKWRSVTLKERSSVQEHFIDLCHLAGHPTPAADDLTGKRFTFEAGATKQSGGQGWADVWKRGYFAFEYKGKDADLDKAYQQILLYRESLESPPLLIVCDIDTIVVHTNFTGTAKRIVPITLEDLLTPEGMRNLRAIFYEPEHFKSQRTTEQVTREAAEQFAKLSDHLRAQGQSSPAIAHFSIRLLFGLFAEDIEILPKGVLTRLIERGRQNPGAFSRQLRHLFSSMASGDDFGERPIRHFNGGLFNSGEVLPLDHKGLEILHGVAGLDWSSIEPSIFGTLFQRSLDPARRSQLGAHYTSKDDILLIVEPVLMAPLRRKWAEVQQQVNEEAGRRDAQIQEWQARADRTQDLVEKRDRWLNPPGIDEAELKKRTLTNLYNQRPTWLDLAHKELDAAVFAAYGWPPDLTDEQILERLLALNLERAGKA